MNITNAQNSSRAITVELKKVSWPSRSETVKLTTIVIVSSLCVGAYIGVLDVIFAFMLRLITK